MPETPTPVSVSETSPAPQPFAERLSDGLQHIIQVVVGAHRKPHDASRACSMGHGWAIRCTRRSRMCPLPRGSPQLSLMCSG